jgi:hypothetical protein
LDKNGGQIAVIGSRQSEQREGRREKERREREREAEEEVVRRFKYGGVVPTGVARLSHATYASVTA